MMRADKSVRKNSAVSVGRGFSHDWSVVNAMRFQPLPFGFAFAAAMP
jgi:hypothetical protein